MESNRKTLQLSRTYWPDGRQTTEKSAYIRRTEVVHVGQPFPNNKENGWAYSIDAEKIKNIQTKPYYYGTKNVAKHAKEIGITYRCSVKRVR